MLCLKFEQLPVGVQVAEWLLGRRRTGTFVGQNQKKDSAQSGSLELWIEWNRQVVPGDDKIRQRLFLMGQGGPLQVTLLGEPLLVDLLSLQNLAPELYERQLTAGSKLEIDTKGGELLKVSLVQPITLFDLLCSRSSTEYLVCADEEGQSIVIHLEQMTRIWAQVILIEQFGPTASQRLARLATWNPTRTEVLIVRLRRNGSNPGLKFLAGRISSGDGAFLLESPDFSLFYSPEHLATHSVLIKQSLPVDQELRGPLWLDVSKPGAKQRHLVATMLVSRSASGISFELVDSSAAGYLGDAEPGPDSIYRDLLAS